VPTCPSCGKELPGEFPFCPFCTAPLQPAPPAPTEERKVVSVLFCDLVGFTARSDSADPEDVRARIRPYHQRLRTEIERYGGIVEKFVGDAVMAVFGAPVAHEDDAERSVRAGLRVLEAIEELNETDRALELQVRVGINTGEAVVALGARPEQGEGLVTGDVVNTASRLQSAAPVGGIAVGEDTYRATKEIFDYVELEPVSVKGKAEPLPIWQARSARARFGTDLTRTQATPLVGRELEQNLLQSSFERSARHASVQLVTIVGEPGIGKSRLVSELLRYIDDRAGLTTWRQGRCLPYGEGVSFWALGEIVKAQAGILESDSPEQAAAKLDAALPAEAEDREWLLARLASLVGAEAEPAAQDESFTAWRRFLESLAVERPAVFVFEDLHWADEALLAFLEHLAEWSEGVPLFLLCTARPELYEQNAGWAGGTRNATTINLAPLTDEETARLISALLDAAVLPAEVQALVLERAGGNPLYAEEFVRMLKDRELLGQKGRILALEEGAELAFPDSLQALIAARLDTLSPQRKPLLQDAAVLGKIFWAGAVAEMGGREEHQVRDGLHDLSRKELVRPVRTSSMEGESEYAFWHALVRDVCYGQIPRAARAAKHRRAAEWIEQQAHERVDDVAEVLAHHYVQALELSRAAGESGDARELEAPALRFLLLSGDRSLGLNTARAEADYAQALELTPPGHPQRAAVLDRLGGALSESGRYAEAGLALEEAIADFQAQGDRLAAGRTASCYAQKALYYMGDARWEAVLAQGVAMLESEPPGPELVQAYTDAAGMKCILGSNLEAVEWADRALALATELGLAEPAPALGFRARARCDLGDAGGLQDFERALKLAQEQDLATETASMYNNFAEAIWPVEGPASALKMMRFGIEFSDRRGLRRLATHTASSMLNPLYELGEWDEAMVLAKRLSERAGATLAVSTWVYGMQARLFVQRGQLEEATAAAESAVAGARQGGENWLVEAAFSGGALVHLARGEADCAVALLAELERLPSDPFYASYLPAIIRTAVACGDRALAERLMEGVEPVFPLHEHALRAAQATLAEAGGELEKAVGLYADAADRWRGFGNVPERVYALLGQGRSLLALGRPGADPPLREAREIFARLGARPLLDKTDALLERVAAAAS
jgi:class 3 adenylate cyclase